MNKESWTFKNIFQRQTKLAAYIIICATLVVIGASYALFFQVDSNTNNQVVEAGDLTFTYSNETVINNSICFEPMSLDEANLYASSCSYQLSIRNTGTLVADYDLYLVPRADNTADLSNLKLILRENGSLVEGYPKGIVSGEGDGTHVGTTNSFLSGIIGPGETILYSAQIYVDDTTSFAGSENKKVSFDIRGALKASDTNPITSEKPSASNTLAKLQLLNTSLTLTPSTPSNPDFSLIAPRNANVDGDGKEEQTSGLFELEDDYGTSYYFRGNVTNNYVKFGGYYWRIVRINGDGSIRMIYAGDASVIDGLANKAEVLANGYDDSSTHYTQIGTSAFNSSYNDNAYVGYMYGTAGSDNYNDTHTNTNNSTIKTYIDTWYENNLKNTTYESYIADTLFCNDRSVGSDEAIDYATNNYGTTYGKLGYGTNTTLYGGESRLIEEFRLGKGNKATLKCNNKNDAFTVSDTMHGNGALDYPARVLIVSSDGRFDSYSVSNAFGVRPVININADYIGQGDGTASNPYSDVR